MMIFLTYWKNCSFYNNISIISFVFSPLALYDGQLQLPNVIRTFPLVRACDVCKQLTSFQITCEMFQPMGTTEFSTAAKNRTNLAHF